jgi:hypothetical protein
VPAEKFDTVPENEDAPSWDDVNERLVRGDVMYLNKQVAWHKVMVILVSPFPVPFETEFVRFACADGGLIIRRVFTKKPAGACVGRGKPYTDGQPCVGDEPFR